MWASGGIFIELMIHQIDECFWIKDAWPVWAHGVGGRFRRTAPTAARTSTATRSNTRSPTAPRRGDRPLHPELPHDFATFVHGTKCAAQFSGDIHAPTCIYKDQRIERGNIAWRPAKEKVNPWQAEWDALLDAIRKDRPHNEARRAACRTSAAIMGRAAVHTGKIITWDEAMASNFQFCDQVDSLTSSPAPVRADAPRPLPGPGPRHLDRNLGPSSLKLGVPPDGLYPPVLGLSRGFFSRFVVSCFQTANAACAPCSRTRSCASLSVSGGEGLVSEDASQSVIGPSVAAAPWVTQTCWLRRIARWERPPNRLHRRLDQGCCPGAPQNSLWLSWRELRGKCGR